MQISRITFRGTMGVKQFGAAPPPPPPPPGPPPPPPPPPPAPASQPTIGVERHPIDRLQVGNEATDTYHIEDNRWGVTIGGQTGGAAPADGFPERIIGIYYESYHAWEAFKIDMVPLSFNVIFLFHCKFNGDGSPRFDHHADVTSTQIQACRNRGQKVILTVGGAANQFTFANRTQSTAFRDGFIAIASVMGGVDGCDFNNYEQIAPTQTFIDEMIWISQQLKAQYGQGFAITSPPQPNSTNDRTLIDQMDAAGVLTFCQPQYYDWVGFKAAGFISTRNNDWVSAVGATKVLLGLAANYDPANSPTLQEGINEWNICRSNHPSQRGVMAWNARNNNGDGNVFGRSWSAIMAAIPSSLGGGPITEGSGSSQYAQSVGRYLPVGSLGEVAWRTTWRYPQFVNGVNVESADYSEVKGFPSIIYGRKPGYLSNGRYPANEQAVRLPDGIVVTATPADAPAIVAASWARSGGSVSTLAPSGHTPGTDLPRALPLTAGTCLTTGFYSVSATGKGHLTFDLFLQAAAGPNQVAGFVASPITHEIAIPMRNWGDYGRHGFRTATQGTLDHDVTIDGVLYHVYLFKNLGVSDVAGGSASAAAGLRYNFGSLNGSYTNEETASGRIGWKFIVFQHDGIMHPLQADGSFRIDIAKFLTHLATKTDSRGVGLIQNNEYLVSHELGVEMVYGQGDLTIWNYRVVAPAAP